MKNILKKNTKRYFGIVLVSFSLVLTMCRKDDPKPLNAKQDQPKIDTGAIKTYTSGNIWVYQSGTTTVDGMPNTIQWSNIYDTIKFFKDTIIKNLKYVAIGNTNANFIYFDSLGTLFRFRYENSFKNSIEINYYYREIFYKTNLKINDTISKKDDRFGSTEIVVCKSKPILAVPAGNFSSTYIAKCLLYINNSIKQESCLDYINYNKEVGTLYKEFYFWNTYYHTRLIYYGPKP